MKKLLALVLVLGMASMASAGLQISVHPTDGTVPNWDPLNPEASQITVKASDYLRLDIYNDADVTPTDPPLTWAIVTLKDLASIAGGVTNPAYVDRSDMVAIINDPEEAGLPALDGGPYSYMWGLYLVFDASGTIPMGTTIWDDIMFHCEIDDPANDALIQLWQVNDDDGSLVTMLDEVVIHQVPEPLTMALMGLGGLALLRRRRA